MGDASPVHRRNQRRVGDVLCSALTAAFLGNAGERVVEPVEGIDVTGGGAADRLSVDLHSAGLLESVDQLRLRVRLFDEGALILGEEVEFRGADGDRVLGAVAERISHLDAYYDGDSVLRPARDIEIDRTAPELLGGLLLGLGQGKAVLLRPGRGIG